MKYLLAKNNLLHKLSEDIKFYSDRIKDKVQRLTPPPPSSDAPSLSQDKAALIIQRMWRGIKIKEIIAKSPYFAYISLIDPADEQQQLSAIMFGRHVAEIRQSARERVDNPLINVQEVYHRSVHLANAVTDAFFKEFDLPDFDPAKNTYMPITLLKNNPIQDVVDSFKSHIPDLQLVTKEPYSIAVLVIPKNEDEAKKKQAALLQDKVKNLGLVASSWEIAENLRATKISYGQSKIDIALDPKLPKTKDALLDSEIIIKLNRIATSGGRYPTKILAKCLQKILQDLPELSPQAIQRIALMLDLTNTFYNQNYPRYAFCVYAIIHEISLSLLTQTDEAMLEKEFARFQDESFKTLLDILALNKSKLKESTFIASSSTSGVSACAVAMKLVSKLQTVNGVAPKVKIFKPCYYELPNISSLNTASSTADADVLMISAGPIVNPEGLTPGVDINLFVRRNIINDKRTKPVAIVIDATSSLYKNMKLDEDVKKLVEEGKISIIIHESHQKFGLIHSDQAQYGRVFGWCSKEHFKEADLKTIQENSRDDFYKHVDLRIGSFISTRCQKILEDIKEQHFSNGAILRNILIQTSLIAKDVVTHEDMQQNLNELYFLNDEELSPGTYTSRLEKAAFGILDYRSSFGHYSPTATGVINQRRLSPDASDALDCLVQACHIRLSLEQSVKKMLGAIIGAARDKDEIPLEQQIVVMSMLHNIISNTPLFPTNVKNVNFISHTPTQKDLSFLHTEKNILFIKAPGQPLKMGYYAHDNIYKQKDIYDSKILKMSTEGTLNKSDNLAYIKAYLSSLQKAALPANTNLAVIFAAITNALECCYLLKDRQYGMKINQWLRAAQEQILLQYKPEKASLFLDTVRYLYNLKVPVKDNQLLMLSKHPNLCLIIKNQKNSQVVKSIIEVSMILGTSIDLSQVIKNKNFVTAVLKIHDANEDILLGLKKASEKHEAARNCSKKYLEISYAALLKFYSESNPEPGARANLLKSFKNAENLYTGILSKDRSTASKTARYILKAITNFIAALTLGIAHYVHYKATGTATFFSGTTSEGKLKNAHAKLSKDMGNSFLSSNPAPGA